MSIVTNNRVIENGARDLVIQCLGVNSAPTANTADETGATKIAAATYGLGAHTKIRRVLYTVYNYVVQVTWDGGTPASALFFNGAGDYNFDFHRSGCQGAWNDAATPTGNILFTTTSIGAAATAGPSIYSLTFFIVKGT